MTRLGDSRRRLTQRWIDVKLEGGPRDGEVASARLDSYDTPLRLLTFAEWAPKTGRRPSLVFNTYFRQDDRVNDVFGEPRWIYVHGAHRGGDDANA